MKKVFLSLALVASLLVVSCKESTQDKVEDATEAVGTEVETAAEKTADAIDSTATETGEAVKVELRHQRELHRNQTAPRAGRR